MTYHALSLGAGVNSTALLHLVIDEKQPLDDVVFADTGAEKPETYEYLNAWIVPYLEKHGIRFTTVKAKETLIERCLRGHTIPDRRYRWSTRDYKIRPIYKYLKPHAPVVCYLGIAADEAQRVKQENRVDWLTRKWPLIDHGLGREGCARLIRAHDWPVPPKSGCWFCPFQRVSEWRELYRDNPSLFKQAVQLEKNGSRYPEFALVDGTLDRLAERFEKEAKAAKEQSSLDQYAEECEGFCFT